MLVYVDTSLLARCYLADEPGHEQAVAFVRGGDHVLVSATWTVVETTSALCRAAATGRSVDLDTLLAALDYDTSEEGALTLLRADPVAVEATATKIVRAHRLRSLDALHLAVAELAARPLAEPDQPVGFATRDAAQYAAAMAMGFVAN